MEPQVLPAWKNALTPRERAKLQSLQEIATNLQENFDAAEQEFLDAKARVQELEIKMLAAQDRLEKAWEKVTDLQIIGEARDEEANLEAI